MFSELAFFSFVQLTDPSQHRNYNEWHQLDHRPENLALPGVAWGDRWARPAGYKDVSSADSELAGVDYAAMYWFRSPIEQSLEEWDRLGEASFQWGRGPIIPGVSRRMMGFYRPVKGYASPHALVSPDVLPFRPNRGLHLTLTRFQNGRSLDAHEVHRAEDRVIIPALLEIPGVAGAWTFSFSHAQQHATLPLNDPSTDTPGGLRIRLLYLDQDPLEVAANIERRSTELANDLPSSRDGQVVLSTPLRTIIPWQDWE